MNWTDLIVSINLIIMIGLTDKIISIRLTDSMNSVDEILLPYLFDFVLAR